MSARSKKVSTKTTLSQEVRKQPTASAAKVKLSTPSRSDSPLRERSVSPLSISRHEEKDELAYLNDRLAGYIDYVRQLENDKDRLTKRIQIISEEQLDKSQTIRSTYENEINSLRALVDDYANKRAMNDIECKTAKETAKDAKALASRLEHENAQLEKQVEKLERDLASCKADPEKFNKLKKDNDVLKKKCESMRCELDDQTRIRTELENRLTSLKEELDFQRRVLADERESFVMKTTTIEEEIVNKKVAEYESRLADELREIRNQTADELDSYKLEMEAAFSAKLEQLKSSNAGSLDEISKVREELTTQRRRNDELNSILAQKISEADLYKRRMQDIQAQLDREKEDFDRQMNVLKDEIDRLNEELQFRLKEFTDLLHAKVSLDQEIMMYRKMLEGEENRLKIPTPQRSSSFSSAFRGKKRRLEFEGMDDTALSGSSFLDFGRPKAQFAYQVTNNAIGDLEFDGEQSGKGKWIRIVNKSAQDSVNVAGWKIEYSADGKETNYTLPDISVKKGAICTIWSSDSGTKHNPPSDLVMPKENFTAGTNIVIRLIDSAGEEQATCNVTKERIMIDRSRRFSRGGSGDERCSLM